MREDSDEVDSDSNDDIDSNDDAVSNAGSGSDGEDEIVTSKSPAAAAMRQLSVTNDDIEVFELIKLADFRMILMDLNMTMRGKMDSVMKLISSQIILVRVSMKMLKWKVMKMLIYL